MEADFVTVFSFVFCLLGLKMLFGCKPVTAGSVLLLGSVSATAASAWSGTTGPWVQYQLSSVFHNYTSLTVVVEQAIAAAAQRMGRSIVGDDEVEAGEL